MNDWGSTFTVGSAEAMSVIVESLSMTEVTQEGVSTVLRQQHIFSYGKTRAEIRNGLY